MALAGLVILSVLFAATHIGMSHGAWRAGLVERLGEKGFLGVYTLVSFVTLGGAIWLLAGNRKAGPVLWVLPGWLLPLVFLLMLAAFLLLAFSVVNPSPTGMRPARTDARGILRVTRHPMNMGIACFALAHLLANGNLGDVFFFGSLFVVGLFGAVHQDRRKLREKGEAFARFQAETSILPFGAILSGRNRLDRQELSAPVAVGAAVAFLLVLLFHAHLFGVSAF